MKHRKLMALLLTQEPKTEAEALECEEAACKLAREEGFAVQYRPEGAEYPQGFFVWPVNDAHSIGACYLEDTLLFGWRWSKPQQRCLWWGS